MQIIQDFIPWGRRNRPGYFMEPQWITIHNTGSSNEGADALMHARYIKGDEAAARPASWHFTVDALRIVQHLPLDENGWHAGDGTYGPGNRQSIGIEICMNKDMNYMAGQLNAAWLCWWLLDAGIVPLEGLVDDIIVPHQKWTGKYCPSVILSSPGGMAQFREQVLSYLPAIDEPEPEPLPEPEPTIPEEQLPPEPEVPDEFETPDKDRTWIDEHPEEFEDGKDPYAPSEWEPAEPDPPRRIVRWPVRSSWPGAGRWPGK